MGADYMQNCSIEGIIVPLLTPITPQETPCFSELEALTDYVIDGGVNAIFANGTTGEFARFPRRSGTDSGLYCPEGRWPGSGDCGRKRLRNQNGD